jgi:hypothetical protein
MGLDYLYKDLRAPTFAQLGEAVPFHFFECDVSGGIADDIDQIDAPNAMALGRWPANLSPEEFLLPMVYPPTYPPLCSFVYLLSFHLIFVKDFPPFMETTFLYPIGTSIYTRNDIAYDVPCSSPIYGYDVEALECPDPYVKEVLSKEESCVKPCPSPA